MTSIEIHKRHIKEHIEEINDAIIMGMEQRPATISLHASACSISLLEIYLHVLGKISVGTMIKHGWFKRPKDGQKKAPLAERKFAVDFPNKDRIFDLMYTIEENRNKLIYGKPTKISLSEVLNSFQELHKIIKDELSVLGEEIE